MSKGGLSGLSILLVEDNDNEREVFRMLLEHFGARPITAKDAQEGLAALGTVEPHLVIADVLLGDHDAFWLLQEVRKRGWRVPFLAVSGEDFDAGELSRRGFVAFLRKPADHQRLVEAVLKATKRP